MNAFPPRYLSDKRKSAIQNPKWLGLSVIAFLLVMGGTVAEAQREKKIPRIGYLTVRAGPSDRDEAFRRGCETSATSRGRTLSSSADLPMVRIGWWQWRRS